MQQVARSAEEIGHVLPSPTDPSTRPWRNRLGSRWQFATLAVACVLLALAFQLTRGTGTRVWNSLWAEDYGVLLQGALRHGLWHNLVTPYAGYLQVVPRLLAQPMAWLPLTWAAPYTAVVECSLVVGCAAIVWNRSGLIMRSPVARLVATGVIPLLPQAGNEVNAALIDAHWYLVVALFWVMLVPAKTVRGQLLAAGLALFVALSDPLAVIALLPALVAVVRDSRRYLNLIAPAALMFALGLQQWVHLHETTFRYSQTALRAIPEITGLRVILNTLVGDRYLGHVYSAFGPASIVVASALLGVVTIGLAFRSRRASILYAAVFLVGAGATTGLELALRGTDGYLMSNPFYLFPSRYFVTPIIFLWSALALLVDGPLVSQNNGAENRVHRRRLTNMAAAVLAVMVVIQVAVEYRWGGMVSPVGSFNYTPERGGAGPLASAGSVRTNHTTWSDNLRYMEAACLRPANQRGPRVEALTGEHSGSHDTGVAIGPGDVSVYPDWEPSTSTVFALVLPCSRFTHTRSS